ncbi:MAG: hypothetical protein ACP5LQ_02960 [Candidatus Methanodesulfokora sp.]
MKMVFILILVSILIASAVLVGAGVPVAVYGYVYMPDGSPAAGASVSVSGGGDSKWTSAGGSGGYSVTLNVDKVPTSVSVSASKGSCSASTSRSGVEGSVRIDLVLRCPSQPSKPPSSPSSSSSGPLGGSEEKEENKSAQLKIEAADVITFLRISVRNIYHVNDTIVINGSISPPFRTTVELVFVKSGREFSANVQTDEKGAFSYRFKTNETGEWKVYARFPGMKGYLPSVTDALSFVVKDFPKISYNYSLGMDENRSIVLVQGRIFPADPDLRVRLLISLDNESWAVLRESRAENGSFSFSIRTGMCGTFKLKVASTETRNLEGSDGNEIALTIPCPKREIIRNITIPVRNVTEENLSRKGVLEPPLVAVSSFILGFITAALILRRKYT